MLKKEILNLGVRNSIKLVELLLNKHYKSILLATAIIYDIGQDSKELLEELPKLERAINKRELLEEPSEEVPTILDIIKEVKYLFEIDKIAI